MNATAIDPDVFQRVLQRLREIEARHNVRILYAAESGSRAWGFASPDSDYDVRFLYVRPLRDYVCLKERRDVIDQKEEPITDDLDINGWDLRKALQLALGTNPALHEWLRSPLVYGDANTPFKGVRHFLRTGVEPYFSPRALCEHYWHMARSNWRAFLDPSLPEVPRKRYLYVVRSLLAMHFVGMLHSPPPLPIDELRASVSLDAEADGELLALLDAKRAGEELGVGPRLVWLDRWIAHWMVRENYVRACQSALQAPWHQPVDAAPLDKLLLDLVVAYNGP